MTAFREAAPAAQKLSFDNGGAFMRETRRDVERYLSQPGVRARAQRHLYAKAALSVALSALCWSVLMFASPGVALGAVCFVGLVTGTALVAFSIMHDANHGAYFRTRRANHLLGWTADVALGISSYAWRVKHNVAHHTYTNVDGYDADITQVPYARFMPVQEPRPWYRLQHLYIWPLYTLMVLRWQTLGDLAALRRGRIGNSAVRIPRRWDLAGLLAGKLLFVGWAIVVPLLVFPWWLAVGGYVAFAGIMGLVTAVTFQLAHCVEEAEFSAPEELLAEKRVWAVHEVETTVDFCPRNPVLTWALGGLNFQIEHHLFPRVPHTHYPRIAEIVRRNCARHGIRYTVHPSLYSALRSHYRHLRTLGRQGQRVEIEMG
ncbi:MAG TPA: acyl-CoA desaturase [Gaiellaceae bacterium]|nr:acyl-CoA desaturase [Gaiellaceae bacterium]